MQISSLNADIVDRILTSLTDFESLGSVLLASKSVYRVYCAHPVSIKRAIAHNVVGPALPQALRFIRCDRRKMRLIPTRELLGEDELEKNPCLTCDDIIYLTKITKQAQGLEDIFSWREKDHNFRTSRLSAAESYRFRRALFRICLLISVYNPSHILEDTEDTVLEPDVDMRLQRQYQFLDTFPTSDIKEIGRLGAFLEHLAGWSANAYSNSGDPNLLLAIPDPDDLPDDLSRYVLSSPVDHILSTREVSSNTEEVDLLTGTPETNLSCQLHVFPFLPPSDYALGGQCHVIVSTRTHLWGQTDWDYLRGYANPSRMCSFLKGQLPFNPETRTSFREVWTQHQYELLIDEVFNCKTPAYDSWEKHDLLCLRCLCQFLRDHLHIWYTERKQDSSVVPKEDCWYGYNCRTQAHNHVHATKLNHWCEPTRGDAHLTPLLVPSMDLMDLWV
ncbi:hypothetical protein J3A83DRAFT_4090407 [Scleroderma citrinum]